MTAVNLRCLPKRMTAAARFDASYIPEPNSGCWLWLGRPRKAFGYGAMKIEGKIYAAHRASWVLQRGAISQGSQVLHRCDNPACVNPDHLFLGTHADNMADRSAKGRQSRGASHSLSKVNPARGENNGNARLTAEDVAKIRAAREPQRTTAKRFGVTQALISKIKRKEIWT